MGQFERFGSETLYLTALKVFSIIKGEADKSSSLVANNLSALIKMTDSLECLIFQDNMEINRDQCTLTNEFEGCHGCEVRREGGYAVKQGHLRNLAKFSQVVRRRARLS